VVVGGWLVQAQGTPKIAKIRLRIIRVCRINGVLIRMGRLKSLYDPSLAQTHHLGYCWHLGWTDTKYAQKHYFG